MKMIVRIVKMNFKKELTEEFLSFFENYKDKIRNFPGCQYLQIIQDIENSNIIFSYSHWNNEESLNNYRNSALFNEIWPKTKIKFDKPAEAWTTFILHDMK